VQYVISSRGTPIGTTDLDFLRFEFDGTSRSGWFHPNATGEALMPRIASVLPAMRAFVCRTLGDANGRSIVQPSFRDSALFADLAEAMHHVAALDLTLHHPDGALIPTLEIGIQDTAQLQALHEWTELEAESEAVDEEDWDDDLQREIERDLDLWAIGWRDGTDDIIDDAIDAEIEQWFGEEDAGPTPRYQVHLRLAEADAIP
jgi:hypothetical protein